MELLTPAQIRQADDIEFGTVPVPEWGGSVRVRGLTGTERDKYEESLVDQRRQGVRVKLKFARARLVIMAAVDADGNALFSEEDIGWLTTKSARALNRVAEKARELSGMTEEDEEELLGNSGGAPGASSPTVSPSGSESPGESS